MLLFEANQVVNALIIVELVKRDRLSVHASSMRQSAVSGAWHPGFCVCD
jgi:hypothetical protein